MSILRSDVSRAVWPVSLRSQLFDALCGPNGVLRGSVLDDMPPELIKCVIEYMAPRFETRYCIFREITSSVCDEDGYKMFDPASTEIKQYDEVTFNPIPWYVTCVTDFRAIYHYWDGYLCRDNTRLIQVANETADWVKIYIFQDRYILVSSDNHIIVYDIESDTYTTFMSEMERIHDITIDNSSFVIYYDTRSTRYIISEGRLAEVLTEISWEEHDDPTQITYDMAAYISHADNSNTYAVGFNRWTLQSAPMDPVEFGRATILLAQSE